MKLPFRDRTHEEEQPIHPLRTGHMKKSDPLIL